MPLPRQVDGGPCRSARSAEPVSLDGFREGLTVVALVGVQPQGLEQSAPFVERDVLRLPVSAFTDPEGLLFKAGANEIHQSAGMAELEDLAFLRAEVSRVQHMSPHLRRVEFREGGVTAHQTTFRDRAFPGHQTLNGRADCCQRHLPRIRQLFREERKRRELERWTARRSGSGLRRPIQRLGLLQPSGFRRPGGLPSFKDGSGLLTLLALAALGCGGLSSVRFLSLWRAQVLRGQGGDDALSPEQSL